MWRKSYMAEITELLKQLETLNITNKASKINSFLVKDYQYEKDF